MITKESTEEAGSPKYGVFSLAGLLSFRLAGICGPERSFFSSCCIISRGAVLLVM